MGNSDTEILWMRFMNVSKIRQEGVAKSFGNNQFHKGRDLEMDDGGSLALTGLVADASNSDNVYFDEFIHLLIVLF